MPEQQKPVLIVGAGLSGLTTAYFLQKKGIPVEIWEGSGRVGGLIRTDQGPLLRTEYAANGFLATKLLEDIAQDIGVELQAAAKVARRRFIFWKQPRRWPLNFWQTLALAPLIFRFFFYRESLRPLSDESIAAWARRQAGEFLVDRLLQPALQGIYAGDTEKLSAELLLGPLLFSKKDSKPVRGKLRGTVAPKGGMQEFTDRLAQVLRDRGAGIYLNKKASLSDIRNRLSVLAVNAKTAADFIRDLDNVGFRTGLSPEMLPVIRTSVAWKRPKNKLHGFGVLMASGQGFRSLGALSDAEIFPRISSPHQETWMFGGVRDPDIMRLSDQELQTLIEQERLRLLSDDTKPDAIQVVRWPEALPHYSTYWKNQLDKWSQQKQELEQQGLYFVGNYLGSLGLSRILEQNRKIADQIAKQAQPQAQSQKKRGLILANIGTPKTVKVSDVANYLNEFLLDPDVISLPWVLRWPLVRGLIVPQRAPQSAKKYAKIWTPQGSPLLVHTVDLAKNLEKEMHIPVRVGMRYGSPNLKTAMMELKNLGVEQIDVVPMFPQYAAATTLSVVKEINRVLPKPKPESEQQQEVRVLREFYNHPEYIRAMTDSLKSTNLQDYEHVLFSFHGLPEAQVKQDPKCHLGTCCDHPDSSQRRCYRAQCVQTAAKLAEQWQIPNGHWSFSFQSRLGRAKWIQPYTDQTLQILAQRGVRSVLVLTPAFTTDCLETLEEIQIEMKELFLSKGGERFDVVPCLNASSSWTTALAKICQPSSSWNSLHSELMRRS